MMKHQRLRRGVLVVGISVLFLAGSAWAMGKKAPKAEVEGKTLGEGATMTKTYDPLTGTKTMDKLIGKDGTKEMIITKDPKEGATVFRSWGSSPSGLGSSSGGGPSSHPGKGQGKGRW